MTIAKSPELHKGRQTRQLYAPVLARRNWERMMGINALMVRDLQLVVRIVEAAAKLVEVGERLFVER